MHFHLDSGEIVHLAKDEIEAILRAADILIATGGRSVLSKVLKGSKDKKLLEHGLDLNPVYGFYSNLTIPEITQRIDWAIMNDYLKVQSALQEAIDYLTGQSAT